MSRTFTCSDLHLNHKNIIGYENRPFKDVEEMNEKLVENWNNTVKKDDTVFVLGDISFGGKELTKSLVERLQGRKILIMGNHDRGRTATWWKEVGFDEVSPYPIIYKGFYILSHEPVYMNEHMPYVNVHGHLHGTKIDSKQFVNVSVENTNYRPLLFDEIEKMFADQEGAGE